MKNLRSALCLLLLMTPLAPAIAADRVSDPIRMVMTSDHPLETALSRGFAVRDGRVQVVALTTGGDTSELEQWLRSRGGLFVLAIRDRVQAFIPPGLLPKLQRRPEVVVVERPRYVEVPEPVPPAAAVKQTTLAVTSEALDVMNVAAWHAEGFTGTDIRVGIIDAEFGGWQDLLGVELPPADRTTYQGFGGSSVVADQVHGTACAEIVHDIAPDAELFLAHVRTVNDVYAALDWLTGHGVDVVTMSLGWNGSGPGDGTGQAADEITAFVAATDAVFMSSAGNERRSHWQGQTIDGNGNDWVDFLSGDDLNRLSTTMSNGDRIAISITWDDWVSPTTDYGLHLYNLDGAEPVEVAVSNRPQTGQSWQTPFEEISYTAPGGGRFGVRISRAGVVGANDMELFSQDSDLDTWIGEGSLAQPADSGAVVAVAAVSYNAPYGVRSFSSAGPTNGPGGTLAGGEIKPDLSGYDGVSTVSYGPRNFYGTSAASPHAAGTAAVVRDAEPGFDSAGTRAFLEGRASDLGSGGKDNDYGWGRVFLGQTPGSTCTFTIDPVSAMVPSAGGGGIIRLTTDSGCPWTTSSRAEWLSVAPASGAGPRVLGFTAAANLGPERVGEILVADLIFVVTQVGSECSFTLNPTSQTVNGAGGGGQFGVQTNPGCSWTATTNDAWITVTTGAGSGSGSVLYNVDVNHGEDERTGSIAVADQSFTVIQTGAVPGETYMVAGIAETEGLQQTRWKSDLAILNPGTEVAEIGLFYRHGGGQAEASLSVGSGEIAELVNVAADTFGVPDSAGAVEVQSTMPLIVTARTYNEAPQGTFGQFVPGVTSSGGVAPGQVAALSQLSSNSEVRTNIGFVDLGGSGALARVRLFDGNGGAVGSELGEIIPAGGWFQRNRVFRVANAGNCTGCYALVDIAGGDGPIWAYASVVDNDSGDPTTIPMERMNVAKTTVDERYLVAGIAETDGANQTKWKSNLALLNLSGQGVTTDLIYRYAGGSASSSVTLADGELREFENIAADFFAVPGSAGSVDVDADGPLVVTARTFNESPDGTYGQFLPGLGASVALIPGDDGILSQLKSTDDFRTNIGFTNFGETECTARIFLHDDQGERKGVLFATAPAGGWTQVNRVFEVSGVGSCPLGYAIVEVLTSGCRVWAYASVVDNGSGDPTTVPVVIH